MSYRKSVFAIAGIGLFAIAVIGPTQAGSLLKHADGTQNEAPGPHAGGPPAVVERKAASLGTQGEIPLGLLIKTPETPHGASFSRQVARLGSSAEHA